MLKKLLFLGLALSLCLPICGQSHAASADDSSGDFFGFKKLLKKGDVKKAKPAKASEGDLTEEEKKMVKDISAKTQVGAPTAKGDIKVPLSVRLAQAPRTPPLAPEAPPSVPKNPNAPVLFNIPKPPGRAPEAPVTTGPRKAPAAPSVPSTKGP